MYRLGGMGVWYGTVMQAKNWIEKMWHFLRHLEKNGHCLCFFLQISFLLSLNFRYWYQLTGLSGRNGLFERWAGPKVAVRQNRFNRSAPADYLTPEDTFLIFSAKSDKTYQNQNMTTKIIKIPNNWNVQLQPGTYLQRILTWHLPFHYITRNEMENPQQ